MARTRPQRFAIAKPVNQNGFVMKDNEWIVCFHKYECVLGAYYQQKCIVGFSVEESIRRIIIRLILSSNSGDLWFCAHYKRKGRSTWDRRSRDGGKVLNILCCCNWAFCKVLSSNLYSYNEHSAF